MFFWKYKVTCYGPDVGLYTNHGLIHGGNFTDAVDNLENYYGNEICNLYIEPSGEENDPYLFDEQYEIDEKEVVE